MKTNLICLLIFLQINFSYSQTDYDKFDEFISNGNKYKNAKNYKDALQNYTKALKIIEPDSPTEQFDAGYCAYKIGDMTSAEKFIINGIVKAGAEMDYLLNYDGFKELKNDKFYQNIITNYNKYRQQYYLQLKNIDVYNEVKYLVQRDQFVRKLADYENGISDAQKNAIMKELIRAENLKDSTNIEKYKNLLLKQKISNELDQIQWTLINNVDKINIERLKEITKIHGWQPRAWLILWHQRGKHDEDNEVWNYFRPLINTEINSGKISRTFWDKFDEFKKSIIQKK